MCIYFTFLLLNSEKMCNFTPKFARLNHNGHADALFIKA